MRFLEYMLLAILGSAPGASVTPGSIITADSVIQPHGGVVTDSVSGVSLPGQDTGGDKAASGANRRGGGTRNSVSHTKTRRFHHKGHKGGKIVKTANKEASKS